MKRSVATPLICLLGLVGSGLVVAQTNDAAAERARLANQRIEAEAERRAEEEEQRREAEAERQAREKEERQQELARREAEQARLAARAATAAAQQEKQQLARLEPAASPQPTGDVAEPRRPSRAQMDKALEQLRTLGELRDAGHVTEDEFERIKKKILDATD